MALHEVNVLEIYEKLLHKMYGNKVQNLVSQLKIIEELALSIDDICDGESGVTVARRLVNTLAELLKLDADLLSIILKEGKRIFEENAKVHVIALELEKAPTITSTLAYLIEGYEARASLVELYSKISRAFGFPIDDFEARNTVAAYFVIDDLKDLKEDIKSGSPNFVLALNRNKFLNSEVKKLLLEIAFLHFLEGIADKSIVLDLIKTYRKYEEKIIFEDEGEKAYTKPISLANVSATPVMLSNIGKIIPPKQ